MEVPLHIDQKNRHIDQRIPGGPTILQYPSYILENGMTLGFKIKFDKIAAAALLEPRHTVRFRVAWSDTGKKQ